MGRSLAAHEYFNRKQEFWPHVTAALDRLRAEYELVVIEGAGSPAELNLSTVEIVNMAVARYAQSPVILVGDIERGGVFAQLLGTLWLLPPDDRALIQGLVVNKFRGDLALFDRGVEILAERGEVPVLGVLPWIEGLELPEEDAVALTGGTVGSDSGLADAVLDVVVIHLPHISNFDDFDPIASEHSIRLRYVKTLSQLGCPDVVILPGTKNTLGDLSWLRANGFTDRILELRTQGATIIGICGGYQMLGRRLSNPNRVENDCEGADGLNLLDADTVFHSAKLTHQVAAEITNDSVAPGTLGESIRGYEIHAGRTHSSSSWLRIHIPSSNDLTQPSEHSIDDGARSDDGRVWGCYVHGLFHNDRFRVAWLRSLGVTITSEFQSSHAHQAVERSLDRLADAFETYIDLNVLEKIIWNQERTPTHVG